MKAFKLISDPPLKPKVAVPNVWAEWIGVNLFAGRKAPLVNGPDLRAGKSLGKACPDGVERVRLMTRYLADQDKFIASAGHPLRYLASRANAYRNAPELCEPFEVLWALWCRRRRQNDHWGVLPPVRAASDLLSLERMAAECLTILEYSAAFVAFIEDCDDQAALKQWPLAWLPIRLPKYRSAIGHARLEAREDKIVALRKAAMEEMERMKSENLSGIAV